MSTKAVDPKPNPIIEAAAKDIRRKRRDTAPAVPVPTPDQLSLFDLDNLTPKAS